VAREGEKLRGPSCGRLLRGPFKLSATTRTMENGAASPPLRNLRHRPDWEIRYEIRYGAPAGSRRLWVFRFTQYYREKSWRTRVDSRSSMGGIARHGAVG